MSIEIPPEVAESAGVPPDLDSPSSGEYRFPSPARRRLAAAVYLAAAVVAGLGAALGLPRGMAGVAVALAAVAGYHLITAWHVSVEEKQALRAAASRVEFPVGHASAVVRFEGWRSRPVWGVLLYSADDPPSRRALVRVSATDGAVLGKPYEEEVPAT